MLIIGLVRDRVILQPELLFQVSVTHTRAELEGNMKTEKAAREHVGAEFLFVDDPDAVAPFLQSSQPITPVAEASILLYGRHRWGAEWYDQFCLIRYGELPPMFSAELEHVAD
jgi:hypothetical protein